MYNNDNNKVGDHVSAAFSPSFGFSDQRIGNYQVGLVEVGLPRYSILGHDYDDHGGYNTTGLYGHSTLPFAQKKDYAGKANLGRIYGGGTKDFYKGGRNVGPKLAIARRHYGASIDPTYVRPPQKKILDFGKFTGKTQDKKLEETAYGRGGRWGTGAGGRWGFGRTTETETVQAPSMTVQKHRPRPVRTKGRQFAFGGRGIFAWLRNLFAARKQQEQAPVRRILPNLPGSVQDESLIY